MKQFYIRSRTEDGFIWKPMMGNVVKNELGMQLYIYHSEELVRKTGKTTWWYVVEASTGMSLTKGETKKEALDNVAKINEKTLGYIKAQIVKFVKQNGYPPNYVPLPGYDIMRGWDDAPWLHHTETLEEARAWCEEHRDKYPVMVIFQQTEDGEMLYYDDYQSGGNV